MRVLMLSNIFPPGFIGGYELGAYDVASALTKSGHSVRVLTSNYFNDSLQPECNIEVQRTLSCPLINHYPIKYSEFENIFYNFQNIRALISNLKDFNPDLVLSFNLQGLGVFSIISIIEEIGVPHIVYLMDNIFNGYNPNSLTSRVYHQTFGKLKLTSNTRFISMSNRLVTEVESTIGAKINNVDFIPGWVDLDLAKSIRCSKKSEKLNFIFSSRIAPHKGIDILLDAIQDLVQSGEKRFHVDIYGDGLVSELLHNIHKKNLNAYVSYKGLLTKNEMIRTLANYDGLLFPTWEREPFGFIAVEAAASGVIPILTVGTGASEWLVNGYDSIKINRNSLSLLEAMRYLIHLSPIEFEQLKKNCVSSAEQFFNWKLWSNYLSNLVSEFILNSTRSSLEPEFLNQLESCYMFLAYWANKHI